MEKSFMHRFSTRLATALLLSIIGLSSQRASGQQRGVMENEFSTAITINGDGSSTTKQVIRQPIVTVTSTGQRLVMPRCAADPTNPSIPKEWNLRTTAANTGKDCVLTITLSAENMQMLARQLRLSGGDIVESDFGFTVKISRNDPDGSTPGLIRAVLIYKYLITVPVLEEFSNNGIKQGENQVSWSTSSRSHSIWIKGRLPRAGPGDTQRPYLGCWSNPDGVYLYITSKMMRFSQDQAVLNYVEVFSDINRNLYLLKLSNGNELWGYLGLEVIGKRMNLNGYKSYEDFSNAKSEGEATWFREDCDKVLPRLKP
jgi:hypothetical protein